MADACYMACPEVYISDKDGWVQNKNIIPTVFISVELDIEELWTMMVAFVSNVSENKIISHDEELTFEEQDRINAINALDSTATQEGDPANGNLTVTVTQADGKLTAVSASIASGTYDKSGAAATAETNAKKYTDDALTWGSF